MKWSVIGIGFCVKTLVCLFWRIYTNNLVSLWLTNDDDAATMVIFQELEQY
jgi:hypothetical protein